MYWAVIVACVLVGLPFLLFGQQYFTSIPPMPTPSFEEHAGAYIGALGASGYMTVVKVIEIVGGAMVLSGRLLALGLVLVAPVAVNIMLFDLFMVGKPAFGVLLTVLCFFLVWAYRSHFASLFAVKPKIG